MIFASGGIVLPNAMRKSSSVPARSTQSLPFSASRRERFRNSGESGGIVPRPMPFVNVGMCSLLREALHLRSRRATT